MAAMKVNEFMMQLSKDLVEKKNVSESTAAAYIKALYLLNGRQSFKNLSFLRKTEEILGKVRNGYSDNTQKALLTAITSVLGLVKDKPTYKKLYQFYADTMMGKVKEIAGSATPNEKTDKQKDAWMSWDDIMKKKAELQKEVDAIGDAKTVNADQWEQLLHYTVVCLYTLIAPRRNEYLEMLVVRPKKGQKIDDLPKTSNYLVLGKDGAEKMIFNVFKTARTYGTQQIDVPADLRTVLSTYLKFHPLNKKSAREFPFLVKYDGTPLTAVNAITRLLNKTFGKKVGCSMLRHIYLSDRYGNVLEEQKEIAEQMGHSVDTQRDYIVHE